MIHKIGWHPKIAGLQRLHSFTYQYIWGITGCSGLHSKGWFISSKSFLSDYQQHQGYSPKC
jgi:hypothetical protein